MCTRRRAYPHSPVPKTFDWYTCENKIPHRYIALLELAYEPRPSWSTTGDDAKALEARTATLALQTTPTDPLPWFLSRPHGKSGPYCQVPATPTGTYYHYWYLGSHIRQIFQSLIPTHGYLAQHQVQIILPSQEKIRSRILNYGETRATSLKLWPLPIPH